MACADCVCGSDPDEEGVNAADTTVRVPFQDLCTVHVLKMDLHAERGRAFVELEIRVTKTQAYRSYAVDIPIAPGPRACTAREAWRSLTGLIPGQCDAHCSLSQAATVEELKNFVQTQALRDPARLPLDVV